VRRARADSREATGSPRARGYRSAAAVVRKRLRRPPRISLSEWADRYRYVSPPAAHPGPWRTDRVPYLREIMDTISSPDYQRVLIVKCSQSAGSESLINAIGYYIDQEPSSILVIQPNVEPMAKDFSKDRLAPLFRDTAQLRGKVKDPRARDSGNTVLHKEFPGGHVTVAGANSPAGLASRPIRIVLADELDRWGASAGSEGDPLALAEARQTTFRHRKKLVIVTSPGNEGESRAEKEWPLTDQRHLYVPCPYCGHEQPLEWRDSGGKPGIKPSTGDYRLTWEKVEIDGAVVHKPETAGYCCRDCGVVIEEKHKHWMVRHGKWVKHNPTSRYAGFHISGLIATLGDRWTELAAKWLEVKDDAERRKPFYNTKLGLLYVASMGDIDTNALGARREEWDGEVPAFVGVLTAAIDVQGDRIEMEVRGWGDKEESALVRLERFYGDPEEDDVWNRARATLDREWAHEAGANMTIAACMVDSGYKQDAVFRFVKSMPGRNVFASKGVENAKAPLSRVTRANRDGVKVFNINPTTFKEVLFQRLKRRTPGRGYMRFGSEQKTGADDSYFLQFAAEERIVEFVKSRPKVRYVNPGKKRNEAIDLYVGTLAALRARGAIVFEHLGEKAKDLQEQGAKILAAAEQAKADGRDPSTAPPVPPAPRGLRQRGSAGGWWGR
jgi:phage terminase large subunit GpA-like protein